MDCKFATELKKKFSISEITETNVIEIENQIFSTEENGLRIEIIESWLEQFRANPDPNITLINHIVNRMKEDRSIKSADQIAKLFSINLRSLQRLFHKYVGIGPKWIIQRFRIQEVAMHLERESTIPYAHFALELGYFDQAHFIKDFKKTIGLTPEDYLRTLKQP